MQNPKRTLPLVIIVGPTASGKTSLAVDIAKKFNGEIICADSRTIYKDMNIGTAKPTIEEQENVPHWGLDLVSPNDKFSVVDFKKYADKKIKEIRKRRHIPFLVGGTGFYIDAVLFDFQFRKKPNLRLRLKLQQYSVDELNNYCLQHKIKLPENNKNKRYLIRSIETKGQRSTKKQQIPTNCIIVGITTEKPILQKRISQRIEQVLDNNLVQETKLLDKKYGWGTEAMKASYYPVIRKYLNNEITLDDVKNTLSTLDWRLAKRQITWLKRNKFIHWLSLDDAKSYLVEQLAIIEQS